MKNYIIYLNESKSPLSLELRDEKEVASAIDWQEQGGFATHAFGIAEVRNGKIINTKSGEEITLNKGIFTAEAFDAFISSLYLTRSIDKTKPQRYIIEPGKFKGSICSATYTTLDGIERVQYHDGKTLEAYLFEYPLRKVITGEELDALLESHYASLVTAPAPISEDQYNEWLECLPPCRWRSYGPYTAFHISERLTGNLVQWCVKHGQNYYGFTDSASMSEQSLIEKMTTALNS